MNTKKTLFILLFSLPFLSNAQSKWGKEVWEAYMNSCVESAKESLNEELATSYCACTGVKLEKRYPDATKLSSLGQDEIMELAEICLAEVSGDGSTTTKTNTNTTTKVDGPKPPTPPGKSSTTTATTATKKLIGPTKWSKAGYDAFMETCVESAKESLGGETAAKEYCDCSAAKLQVKYPDENKVTVTEAEINKIAEECLGL